MDQINPKQQIEIRNQISTTPFVAFKGREIVSAAQSGVRMKIMDDIEPIKQSLRYVFALIGLKPENLPSDLQKHVLIEFIQSELGEFTAEEIKLAFRMAVAGHLNVDPTHYQNFNAMYLGAVMNSYREFQRRAMKEHRQKMAEMETAIEPSEETKKQMFWAFVDVCILKKWDEFIKTNTIDWSFISVNNVFNVLEINFKLIQLSADEKMEIAKRAKKIVQSSIENPSCDTVQQIRDFRKLREKLENGEMPDDVASMTVRKSREIAIREFFEKMRDDVIDLRETIESIKSKNET